MDETYEQLAERNAVLEAEKAALSEEADRLKCSYAAVLIAKENLLDEVRELEDKLRVEWDRWRQTAEELVESDRQRRRLEAENKELRVQIKTARCA